MIGAGSSRTSIRAMSRENKRRRTIRASTTLATYGVLALGAAVMTLPLLWMLTTSLKEANQVFAVPIQWIPTPVRHDNYVRAWEVAPWASYIFNSVFVGFSVTVITVGLCTLAGYGFAKYQFWGRNVLFVVVLSTLMIPFQVVMVPLFILTRDLGWLNTYLGLILPVSVGAFGIFMMRQFVIALPDELLDAARIDGASELDIFRRIVLPLSRPAMAALAIFTFTGNWDSLLWPLVVTTKVSLRTLPLGLALFNSEYRNDYTALMAASTAVTLPVLVLFLALQRQFVRGIVMSGLKL